MNPLYPSHDDFIKSILSDKQIAVDYIKTVLPAAAIDKLDFSTFRQMSDTYLSDELRKTMSDIVYECKLKSGKHSIKVSLLIEHKSYPDKYTPIQMGGYIFSSFQKQIQNKEPLSVVIPILLYHGEKKWEYRTLADLFKGVDEDWKPYIPSFDFIFNDLNKMSDEAIETLHNEFLAASLWALKYGRNARWVDEHIVKLLTFAWHGEEGLRKRLIIYIAGRNVLKENVLNSLPETLKDNVMNTLEIYYERGIEKGRKEGREEGMEKGREEGMEEGMEKGLEKGLEKGKESFVRNLLAAGKFTVAEIANFADVDESFVIKLKTQ